MGLSAGSAAGGARDHGSLLARLFGTQRASELFQMLLVLSYVHSRWRESRFGDVGGRELRAGVLRFPPAANEWIATLDAVVEVGGAMHGSSS